MQNTPVTFAGKPTRATGVLSLFCSESACFVRQQVPLLGVLSKPFDGIRTGRDGCLSLLPQVPGQGLQQCAGNALAPQRTVYHGVVDLHRLVASFRERNKGNFLALGIFQPDPPEDFLKSICSRLLFLG